VFMSVDPARAPPLREWLKGRGVLIGAGYGTTRLVTHLDVDRGDVERFVGAVEEFFAKAAQVVTNHRDTEAQRKQAK